LKETEGGRNIKEVCREYSIAEATYNYEASDIKRLKELEDQNQRLKQNYDDLSIGH
jgi:putative transposase